ncbi:uncharacterized protein LOC116772089 [Danaus plexippus]|uniref:uncharacterized protein LOC116772089 n=1 Tax=Danaus plexippus TaxID=13037 RepID=UPI002AB2463B|nr:uncharacterized protein LOC116772089 [Danaus plexippus]
MARWCYLLLFIFIFSEVSCNVLPNEMCINYYRTGEDFDLKQLEGIWYAVYYWPPIREQRHSCAVVDFKRSSPPDGCNDRVDSDATFLKASYTNSTGKKIDLYYYGDEEVKHQMRDCNRVSDYIFVDVDDGYVMGINCSNGGRGILLARALPTNEEVEAIVEDIDIMTGRKGSPNCKLP